MVLLKRTALETALKVFRFIKNSLDFGFLRAFYCYKTNDLVKVAYVYVKKIRSVDFRLFLVIFCKLA